jgi:hypothetical protein
MRTQFFTILLSLFFIQNSKAQVTGKVFRDFNANGVQTTAAPDPIEPGLKDVTVNAYDNTGALFTATTAATGTYSISGGTSPYRVEFILPPYYYASKGNVSNTTVQFVAAGGVADLGVNSPDDYWDNTLNPDPVFVVPSYLNGTSDGPAASRTGIMQLNNSTNGIDPAPTQIEVAKVSDVGSVWGVALHKKTKTMFYSAFLKRHVGVGPKGLGGIYFGNMTGSNFGLSGNFDLQGVIPSNGGAALDLGSVTRTTSDPNDDNFIIPTNFGPCRDLDAYAKVGTIGYGDIDIDDAHNLLFMTNLNQKLLMSLDVSGSISSLSTASAADLGAKLKAYDITTLPNAPNCTGGNLRMWGLKIYQGKGYLGVVCDAMTSQDKANLQGYVLSFDPTNIGAGFQIATTMNFAYRPGFDDWKAWNQDFTTTGITPAGFNGITYEQPIISDIEFDEGGNMLINVMSRFGHQSGFGNYFPVSGNTEASFIPIAHGDILHACPSGSNSWILEGTSGCSINFPSNTDGYGGAGEFFDDAGGDGSSEASQGAFAKLMGTNRVLSTVVDPFPSSDRNPTPNDKYYITQGIHWFNTLNGEWDQQVRTEKSNWQEGFGKAYGLGDIEFCLTPAPIEIGNRVFMDTDEDGIQDANEMGLDGVTVKLYKAGAEVASTTTANGGQYIFTNVDALTAYEIKILGADIPSGKQLTLKDAVSTGAADVADSDASLVGTDAIIAYKTGGAGQNNHTLDFGFKAGCVLPSAGTNTPTVGTCTGATANDDAKIDFAGFANADKAEKFEGATYSGTAYSAATGTVTAGAVSFTGLKHNTQYTFRFWNAADACFVDVTITTPTKTCVIPCSLTASATGTTVKCNGGNDGTATASAAGNIAAVTYLWSDAAASTTATISSLSAGTYTVTITESASCTAIASYTVTEPTLLAITCSKVDVTAIGGTNGEASVTASGGTAAYTYLWSDAAASTTASITGLAKGTYMVTVTDANGCTKECSSIVNEPGCLLTATATGTNVKCNGGNDGTATASAAGNIAVVTYLWSDAAASTTATISGLVAGTYTVTITETASCTAVASYTVTEPTLLVVACSKVDVTTIGGTNGEASVTASGGTAAYTYLWSNAATSASITGLAKGTYTVTVTDANGCTKVCSSAVNEPGCTQPTVGTNTPAVGTCTGTTANDDAKIDFTGFTNADKAEKFEGATYNGAAYSAATGTVIAGAVSFTGLKHNTQYTFRFWNAADACFVDVTITTPTKTCAVPCPPKICTPVKVTKL